MMMASTRVAMATTVLLSSGHKVASFVSSGGCASWRHALVSNSRAASRCLSMAAEGEKVGFIGETLLSSTYLLLKY